MHHASISENSEIILKKVSLLPDEKVNEIIDYIDNLLDKHGIANDPLANVIGTVSGEGISSREIDEQLYDKNV